MSLVGVFAVPCELSCTMSYTAQKHVAHCWCNDGSSPGTAVHIKNHINIARNLIAGERELFW